MRYLSLFSGIEAASVAWEPLGWTPVAFAEIEPFPCRLLQHRFPKVPNLGDVTCITENDIFMLGPIDLVVFGSPCQDLSIAGNRKGLAGERSGLFRDAMRIIGWAREHGGCRWALWENVPGAFTSNEGRDFATVVAEMAGIDDPESICPPAGRGPGGKLLWGTQGAIVGEEAMVEWAVLDAQWFGVAQRRRRVFALADFGDWAGRPPVLLEPESMCGHPPARSGQGAPVAGTLIRGVGERDADSERRLLYVTATLDANYGKLQGCSGQDLNHGHSHLIPTCSVVYMPARTFGSDGGINEHFAEREVCDALHTSSGQSNKAPLSVTQLGVRRLTPSECERLQGFPDNWTAIPGAADGPRYKALGNSMAVPVINWIGRSLRAASWEFWS